MIFNSIISAATSLLVIIAMLLAPYAVPAQELVFRRLRTAEYQQYLAEQQPELSEQKKQIEQVVAAYQRSGQSQKTITIPVVFHILPLPPGVVIDEATIFGQLALLNRHFNTLEIPAADEAFHKEKFDRRLAKADLAFCVAKLPDNGIRYIAGAARQWQMTDELKSAKEGGADPVSPNNYLNIWVADLADATAGYAQLPGGPAATDGIVIDYRYFGTTEYNNQAYNEGKTLTHLIGNYLGLYDLWGSHRCEDDYVTDTPIHNAPNVGCAYVYKHVSTCNTREPQVEMTMNFMDNTYDACAYMFTEGQKLRMHAMLSAKGPRKDLQKGKADCDASAGQLQALTKDAGNEALTQTALDELSGSIEIYPNPATNSFSLQIQAADTYPFDLVIYDLLGRITYQSRGEASGSTVVPIECQDWPKGIYQLQLRMQEQVFTKNLIIQ